jgi:hypothetical protein
LERTQADLKNHSILKRLKSSIKPLIASSLVQECFNLLSKDSIIFHIPHNRIHKYLLSEGLAKENVKKKKRCKWIRYEKKHSVSAGHIDWHEDTEDSIKVCAILDDASMKILAGRKFTSINTDNSEEVIDQMVENYWPIHLI